MPSLHLILTEPVLRDAITEQLKLANITEAKADSSCALALTDPQATTIILDDSSLTHETLSQLHHAGSHKKAVLLLGQTDLPEAAAILTETFAKPLRLGHLLARIRFYNEIAPRLRSSSLIIGPYRLEPQNRQLVVMANNTAIRLTEKETMLLEFLAQSPQPVTREELLTTIWGYDGRIDTHTLETHIYQLRRKLDPDNQDLGLLIYEQGAYRLNKS